MKHKLSLDQERIFWKLMGEELSKELDGKDISKWSISEIEALDSRMKEKLIPLCEDNRSVRLLCKMNVSKPLRLDEDSEEDGKKDSIKSTFRRLFIKKNFDTTQPKIKNRFSIYLGYQSADDFIEKRRILELPHSTDGLSSTNIPQINQLIDSFTINVEEIKDRLTPYEDMPCVIKHMKQFNSLHEKHMDQLKKGHLLTSKDLRLKVWRVSKKISECIIETDMPLYRELQDGMYLGGKQKDIVFTSYFTVNDVIMDDVIKFVEKEDPSYEEVIAFYEAFLQRNYFSTKDSSTEEE